jgi:hypothetical protein
MWLVRWPGRRFFCARLDVRFFLSRSGCIVGRTRAGSPSSLAASSAGWTVGSALRALADTGSQFFDVVEDLAPLGHFREDFALRVHDCGVVAAKCLPDLWQ